MIRRTFLGFVSVAGFFWLLYLGSGLGVVSFLFGWSLLGYLLWRAWPAVRSDLAYVVALLPSGFLHRRSTRGDYL